MFISVIAAWIIEHEIGFYGLDSNGQLVVQNQILLNLNLFMHIIGFSCIFINIISMLINSAKQSKYIWFIAILFLNVLASIPYYVFGYKHVQKYA